MACRLLAPAAVAAGLASLPARGDGPADIAGFLDAWCLDCHDGPTAKGQVDLASLVPRLGSTDRTVADADLLRRARLRIVDGMMPPPDHDQPSPEHRRAVAPLLEAATRVPASSIVPPATPPRRLNRVEYANTVRDLVGVDVAAIGALPPDDVGAGFDSVASVLSLSPATLERMMEIAEQVAERACPERDAATPPRRTMKGRQLRVQGGAGQHQGEAALVWSNGHADVAVEVPRDGLYALSFEGFGMQAGPEPVRCAIVVDSKPVAYFDLPERRESPGSRSAEVPLRQGTRRVGVAFLNDFYQAGSPALDRNLVVTALAVEGPLDATREPDWRLAMDSACAAQEGDAGHEARLRWLVARFLRRPATTADLTLLAEATKGVEGSRETQLRAAMVALLVHPEFLFRIEGDPAPGEPQRALTAHEVATRLSYYLWASCPDLELQRAADAGELLTPGLRAAQVARMLRDPRSSALAERFAAQWLGIDGLDARTPDASLFPGVDAALVQSMRIETVLLFDALLREGRPAHELLDADFTFMDARLASHYGVPAPAGGGMRRVPAPADRGGGVLAHASVLLGTSNPTRTSPVKRGKWVLESLLDSAPPPPPPGTPALPERAEDRHGLTLRQSLERHRADPSCAACHRRMDALGFAFEHYDAVGRHRDRADGAPVDSQGELPDGSRIASLGDVRAMLGRDPAFVRSLAKHLLVYATGRGPSPADEAAVDLLVDGLPPSPALQEVVVAVVESPAFLRRGAPPAVPPPVGASE